MPCPYAELGMRDWERNHVRNIGDAMIPTNQPNGIAKMMTYTSSVPRYTTSAGPSRVRF